MQQLHTKCNQVENLDGTRPKVPTWGTCTPMGIFAYPKGYI